MQKTSLILALTVSSFSAHADLIKKSDTGICHPKDSPFYYDTKHYTRYYSMDACLASGGRFPYNMDYYIPRPKSFTNKNNKPHCNDTRHRTLKAQSTGAITYRDSDSCVIHSGRWFDLYTGQIFYYADSVEVDRLVPLNWALKHGAEFWHEARIKQFKNDDKNLFVISAKTNKQKGSKGALEWLPKNRQFHCQYILRFERIVNDYQLQMNPVETAQFHQLKRAKCD